MGEKERENHRYNSFMKNWRNAEAV